MYFPVWPDLKRRIPSIYIPKHGRWHSCINIFQLKFCISFKTVAWSFWTLLKLIKYSHHISFYICTLFLFDRMIPNGFWVIGFRNILDDVAVSPFSEWDPASFSKQWPELFKSGRVLSWKTVEGLALVEWDITTLADVAVSSSSKWDPVWFSKQWTELFENTHTHKINTILLLLFNYIYLSKQQQNWKNACTLRRRKSKKSWCVLCVHTNTHTDMYCSIWVAHWERNWQFWYI